jgi:hypothetical protein
VKVNSRSFGRTGPLVVRRLCDCDVLPWTDCEHTAWDAEKSLQSVIEQAQAPTHSQMEMALPSPSERGVKAQLLLSRARHLLQIHVLNGGEVAGKAAALIREIDSLGSMLF